MYDLLSSVLELGGTFVFAISGGVAAVRRRMDVFGAMVLAFVAGNTGGITRDLLIGATPPAAISTWHYLAMSALAGLLAFFWSPLVARVQHPVQWFDALGLAFFAVAGTEKALDFGMSPLMAALLGMVTGIGGGMLRDMLANDIPVVLRSDFYALAALAGAAVVAGGHATGVSPFLSAILGASLCFVLRFGAIRYGWHLPTARWPSDGNVSERSRDDPRNKG